MMNIAVNKQEIKILYNRLKSSATKRNIPFELTPSDIDQMGFPLTCPILGIPLQFRRSAAADDSYSFERVDSSKGYTSDNTIIISTRANKLKSDATLEEMQKIVNFYQILNEQSTEV